MIYLKAAEIFFSEQPTSVLTVLGSCLAVTMFHQHLGIGAICHGLLPQCAKKNACRKGCTDVARYVECSVKRMAKGFLQIGAAAHEIEVKVFGGADMFAARPEGKGGIFVGKQNVTAALKILEKEGLTVVSMDVGGMHGRKILFNTQSGEVLLKRLRLSGPLADNKRIK